MSIVPCLTWVRRGKAKSNPVKVQIETDDLKRIIEETNERLEETEEGDDLDENDDTENIDKVVTMDDQADKHAAIAMATKAKNRLQSKVRTEDDDDVDKRYNMDGYDDEENDMSNPLKGIGNLTMYASNEEDPYVTLKDNEGESDDEDFQIKPTDNLLVFGRAEKDFCSVEVHVYEEEANLYSHHQILLPSFPLAVEWLDYDPTQEEPGNLIAIATMDPTIDIWDLDLVESLEPIATLGQRLKKKKKNSVQGHKDAVLDLSWNTIARHVLASASADNTVGLWDLQQGIMAMTIKQHTDKVQCVQWHPVEEHMLLSGSFDKTVKMYDCRSPDTNHKSWTLNGEIEKLLWNHFSPFHFFASTDTGHIYCIDSRQDEPVYTLSAHNESVTGLSLSSEISSMLVTTSTDEIVKVWDIANDKPSLVHSRNLKIGHVHCLGNCPDDPYMFGIGGDKIKVWDVRESSDVLKHFGSGDSQPVADDMKTEPVTMDTQDSGAAMDTDIDTNTPSTSTTSPAQASQPSYKPKQKKKKKKKSNNF